MHQVKQPTEGMTESLNITRRQAITSGLAIAATVPSIALADADNGLPLGQKTDQERANESLVYDFCRDWATLDNDLLLDYLAPEIEYHINEGAQVLNGHEEFTKVIGGWLETVESSEWDIYRSFTLGEMVVNERVDHFYFKEEGTPSWHLNIAGMFIVRDNKIRYWRDYPLIAGA